MLAGFFNLLVLLGFREVLAVTIGGEPVTGLGNLPPGVAPAFFCALLPLLVLARAGVSYLHACSTIWMGNRMLHQLRDELFSNLMRQSLTFYQRSKSGELSQLLFHQTRIVRDGAVRVAGDSVKHSASILAMGVFLFSVDWVYTLAGIGFFVACLAGLRWLQHRVRRAGAREEEQSASLIQTTQEALSSIRVVKTHAGEAFERDRFLRADLRVLDHVMRWSRAAELTTPLIATALSTGIASGLAYAHGTGMRPETFILLNAGLIAIYPHALALSRLKTHLEQSVDAARKILAMIDRPPEIPDAPGAVPLENPRGEIVFSDVRFSYPGGHDDAISGCSFTFAAGKIHVLAGRSGSGKSTLLSLILRFHDPRSGSITFDGIDLRQLQQRSLRDHLSIINQDVFLFRDTLANNIRYAKPSASDEEVIAAARRARAHDFILQKPGGYQAVAGDPGCALTGGQQQRIAIARAFLRNAPVLLIDEAYSALDPESEAAIQAALDDLAKGKTVIAIPYRPATFLTADRVLLMEAGRIADSGTHAELIARNESYRQLFDLQFRSPDLASPSILATV
jgi:subfamily B ATP-binding cassette protein MsbA